jgi:hypothetical protein
MQKLAETWGAPQEVLTDHDLLHRCNLSHYHMPHAGK